MVHQRVELNAMTSEQLVAFIERKLAEQGVKKIVPAKETLDEAYRLFERGRRGADQLVAADGGFSAPRSNLSQPVLGAASGAAKSDRPATSSILRAGALVRRKGSNVPERWRRRLAWGDRLVEIADDLRSIVRV
jgi:hypothetical protein